MDASTGKDILHLFDSGEQVLHCYAGGTSTGACVIMNDPKISNDEYVISEYLDVVKVSEVLKGRTIVKE